MTSGGVGREQPIDRPRSVYRETAPSVLVGQSISKINVKVRESMNNAAVKQAFAEWLNLWRWDYFATITFRDPRQPHHALSTVREVSKSIDRIHFPRWFLGTELHKSRTLHVHGLLQSDNMATGLQRTIAAGLLWEKCFKRFGRATVRPVQSREAVTSYVVKYVVKELTEWDMQL